MARSRTASLLIVLAHPDDEIFYGGVLAHLSERGARVTLVCATDGEAGTPHPSVGPVTDVGARRVEELRLSCERLGIEEPVLLRFHDSARKERLRRDDPHALANVDMLDVEAAVRNVIASVQPHVVVTFDPHGRYYHPDHLAISRATTAGFFSSGVMGEDAPGDDGTSVRLRSDRGDGAEPTTGRRADVEGVSTGDGARSLHAGGYARADRAVAVVRFLRRSGDGFIRANAAFRAVSVNRPTRPERAAPVLSQR